MSEPRLVFFAPSPSEPGGAQRRTRLLAQALADRGWQVLVIGRTAGRSWPSWRRSGGVTVVELPGFGRRRLGALCFIVFGVLSGVIVGSRAYGFLALQLSSPASAAGICGLLTRRPFVVMSSTSGLLSETSLVGDQLVGRLRRRLLGRAAAIVGQTTEAAAELRSVFGGTLVAVVPNPVVSVEPPPLNGLPRVAFSGRLSEEKDLSRLLDAWEPLACERRDLRLTLVGAGGGYRSVEAQLRERVCQSPILQASVNFTGWLSDPAPVLSESDVFAFPSISEGMSNALLEACALGRIVVASDIPPNRAVLGDDYPLLFQAGDSDGMTTALRAALDHSGVRARAREHVASRARRFSPAAAAADLEKLLDADRAHHQ